MPKVTSWIFNRAKGMVGLELSSDIGDDMKLLFKVPLALVLILLTILFYGKNGLLTPAPSINKLWGVRS
jgi:hypothetical protein